MRNPNKQRKKPPKQTTTTESIKKKQRRIILCSGCPLLLQDFTAGYPIHQQKQSQTRETLKAHINGGEG